MSKIGAISQELDEFVVPLIYMGATDETIREQFHKLFENHQHYNYLNMCLEKRIRDRDFYADVYV